MTTNNIVRFTRPLNNIVPIDFEILQSNMYLRLLTEAEENELFGLELDTLFDMADEIFLDYDEEI